MLSVQTSVCILYQQHISIQTGHIAIVPYLWLVTAGLGSIGFRDTGLCVCVGVGGPCLV